MQNEGLKEQLSPFLKALFTSYMWRKTVKYRSYTSANIFTVIIRNKEVTCISPTFLSISLTNTWAKSTYLYQSLCWHRIGIRTDQNVDPKHRNSSTVTVCSPQKLLHINVDTTSNLTFIHVTCLALRAVELQFPPDQTGWYIHDEYFWVQRREL